MADVEPTEQDDRVQPDCAQALDELYIFLDGELTSERRTLITTHLDDCNPCLEIFDFEAELRLVVQNKCRDDVPESLRIKIEQTIRQVRLSGDDAEA